MALTTKDELENALAIFSALVAEHFDGIDPFQIQLKDDTRTLLFNDEEHFRLVIQDLIEFNHLEVNLETNDLFEKFPTVAEILHFAFQGA